MALKGETVGKINKSEMVSVKGTVVENGSSWKEGVWIDLIIYFLQILKLNKNLNLNL